MPSRKREVKPVVSTSFPDLLGEEEARIYRENYPSEVTIAAKAKREEAEVDGLLDELLNDDDASDDTLTNSCDDRTELSENGDNASQEKAKFEKPKDDANNESSFLGGLLSFSASSSPPTPTSSSGSKSNKTPSKHVTYADDVKANNEPSDGTLETDSDRSSGREEEEEEAIVIESDDEEETDAGQEVELLEEEQVEEVKEIVVIDEEEGNEEGEEAWHDANGDEDDDEADDSVSCSSSNATVDSNGTQDLLERAHDRLNMQGLFEEVGQLRKIIDRRDKEIEELSGQLRRAVATKCDLVISHTELERHHEFNLKKLEECTKQLVKANFGLVEDQASTDVVSVAKVHGLILW